MFVCCLVNLMFSVIAPLGYFQAHHARVNPMPEGYKRIRSGSPRLAKRRAGILPVSSLVIAESLPDDGASAPFRSRVPICRPNQIAFHSPNFADVIVFA